jgi:hypothetical protein
MKIKIFLSAALVLILAIDSRAQHKIQNSVFGNGAAGVVNSSFRMAGTAGQHLIGVTRTPADIIQSGFWAQTRNLITSVEQLSAEAIPKEFRLYPNYPNPFNPTTMIRFDLPKRSSVTLKLYDLFGREVATLVDDDLQPGEYKVEFEASDLASGVYIYRLEAEGFVQAKKLTLIK